jgi:uncharacterized protein
MTLAETSDGVSALPKGNPFDTETARRHSAYYAWHDETLISLIDVQHPPSVSAISAHEAFRNFVLHPDFSCLGAKAAIQNNTYRFSFYPEMNTPQTTAALAFDFWRFVQERPKLDSLFTTFVSSFAAPVINDEHQWEKILWSQLQSLHELDREHYAWDESVESDPESAEFSFSFAGQAFFIVGLFPESSRRARRFAYPTLVFNLRAQFEWLRERGQFERIREAIRVRDYKLQGSLNPNLSDFGERSEARQYSGRAVEENWRCPFHAGATANNNEKAAKTMPPGSEIRIEFQTANSNDTD